MSGSFSNYYWIFRWQAGICTVNEVKNESVSGNQLLSISS